MITTKQKLTQAFRSLETLVLDNVNLEPAYVKNLAVASEKGKKITFDFDTKTARFGHLGDGKDTVAKLKEVLASVGIESLEVPDVDFEYKTATEPNRLWDDRPALHVVFVSSAENVRKLEKAKENYAAELIRTAVEAASNGMFTRLTQNRAYRFDQNAANQIAAAAGIQLQ